MVTYLSVVDISEGGQVVDVSCAAKSVSFIFPVFTSLFVVKQLEEQLTLWSVILQTEY